MKQEVMLRLILYGLLFYLLYKLIHYLFGGSEKNPQVRGRSKGRPPLDLSKEDVEDADYEDLSK